ncbi:hypothetical protein [Massilia horti]|uniref:hypothetical protein n=1 Tax=Massilia horti TaxID=2562153 RepID=UPI00197CED63|nr:hypothetical protein [Massilia horti]
MFGSTVLEVAIGLTFCFGTVALIVSALQEALASAFRLRANTLLDGVKSMLNDPNFASLAQAVYAHPLVNPHGGGTEAGSLKSMPSYIEPANFAIALVDSIQQTPGDYSSLGRAIDAIPDDQIRRMMQGLYRRAADLPQFQHALAAWFDNAMDRLSGVYKRQQLLISVLISFLLAVLFNIDSIHLFRTLWQHPLASQISTVPGALTPETLQALWALPIGWTSFPPALNADFALQLAGWMVTASTTLFGAPFWFDLLQRAIQMRGTGAKPQDTPRTVVLDGALAVQPEQPAKPVAVA